MPSPLLTLGPFSFEGLESPPKVLVKTKQRLAVHHLGSGSTTTDSLGEDSGIVRFQGIFSGPNAADRIRSIDYLREQGLPLTLTWGSTSLSVIIRELELEYSSGSWIPYRLSCHIARTTNPETQASAYVISTSPITQVSDMLSLLQNTSISPTPDQSTALTALAMLDFDLPSSDDIEQADALIGSIDGQLSALAGAPQGFNPAGSGLSQGEANGLAVVVANSGLQAYLLLARNRVMNIVVSAEGVNQP